MKNVARDKEVWEERRRYMRMKTAWPVGEEFVRGKREDFLFMGYKQIEELTGKATLMESVILAVIGRLPTNEESRLLNAMIVVNDYGTPSLWYNRVARFAGSMRVRIGTALIAGLAVAQAKVFGAHPTFLAAEFLQNSLRQMKESDKTAEEIIDEYLRDKKMIYGFGRPVVNVDERVPIILKIHEELGFPKGEHLELALEMEKILNERKGIIMNYATLHSAILSDLGFTPIQIESVSTVFFIPALLACATEGLEREPAEFIPMACDDIDYQGPPERPIPGR
ncbi:MAG: hypothetical protein HY739_04725 [Desulfobacterales bacterium]|nr:hypothetical protein [Desulfobacterales bacterium]